MAGYSGTPLAKKLGVKPGTRLLLLRAPEGFVRELAELPADVRIASRLSGHADLIVWFTRASREIEGGFDRVIASLGAGLWIAWPKRASGVVTDLSEDVVRRAGLARGLVDYKVCAINDVWSGLKFARRAQAR